MNTDSSKDKKECIYCSEEINVKAKICKWCDSSVGKSKIYNSIRNLSSVLSLLLSSIVILVLSGTLIVVAWNSYWNVERIKKDLQQLRKEIRPNFEIQAIGLYTDPAGKGEDPTQVWSGVILEFNNYTPLELNNIEISKFDINLPRGLVKAKDMWGGLPRINLPKANPLNPSRIRMIAPFTEAKWVVKDYKSGKQTFKVDILATYRYIIGKGKQGVYKYGYKGVFRGGKFVTTRKGVVD